MLAEGAGVSVGLDHASANLNDHQLLKGTLDSIPVERDESTRKAPQGICLDKAYDNRQTRDLVAEYKLTPHIRTRKEEIDLKARRPDWRARRWVVEACHSWLNRNRAILHPLVQEGGESSSAADARQWPHRFQEGPRRDPQNSSWSGLTG